MPTIHRNPYKYASPETWEVIRTAYMRGESGPVLARRFNVTTWNIYKKAMTEGWGKRSGAYETARPPAPAPGSVDWSDRGSMAPEPAHPGETWTSIKDPRPDSMRGVTSPSPGPWRRDEDAGGAPPGYGPMPPHLVPPVRRAGDERPPSGPPAGEARSPAEVAEQAVAAAGRAIAEGRYAEAERLGKLAETMRRLEGAGPARARAAPEEEEEEEEGRNHPFAGQDAAADDLPAEDRPLNCTARTCAMEQVRKTLEARLDGLCDDLLEPEIEDLEDWTDMAQAIGAVCDPDVARLCDVIRAEGLDDIRPEVEALFGPAPHRPAPPRFDPYR